MIILFSLSRRDIVVCGTHTGHIVIDTMAHVQPKIDGYVGPSMLAARVHGNSAMIECNGDKLVVQLRRYYHGDIIFSAGYSAQCNTWLFFVADEVLNSG
jgi:hypothetical protein